MENQNVYYAISQGQLVLPKEKSDNITEIDVLESQETLWSIEEEYDNVDDAKSAFENCEMSVDKDYSDTECAFYIWTLEKHTIRKDENGKEIIEAEEVY